MLRKTKKKMGIWYEHNWEQSFWNQKNCDLSVPDGYIVVRPMNVVLSEDMHTIALASEKSLHHDTDIHRWRARSHKYFAMEVRPTYKNLGSIYLLSCPKDLGSPCIYLYAV